MSILRVMIVAAGATMAACGGGATDATTPPVNRPGTYSVSGRIVGAVQYNVLLRAHGEETEPAGFSDQTGNYRLDGLANGTYTVVPYSIGVAYTFSPESRTVVVAGANLVGQDFSSTLPTTCSAPFAIGPFFPGIGNTDIVAADFNGDGRPDVATIALGHDSLSVYLGNGDGTFRSHVDFATGRDARGITAGDFNGDGKIDLAVAHFTLSSAVAVDVSLGRGDGTFGAATTYSIGPEGIGAIRSADLNGDGRLDLVVAKSTALSVLTGRGDGTFNASVDYLLSTRSWGFAIADLNADGRLDLAAINVSDASTIAVLLGNGDATFAAAVTYPVARNPVSVVALDVNGDGKVDLVTTGSVLLGNGNGTFQPKTDFDPGGPARQLAVGDFNNDTKVDLVIAVTSGVGLLFGNGNGTFRRVVLFNADNEITSLVVGDFNRDGKSDVAITAGTPSGPGGIRFLRNTCF